MQEAIDKQHLYMTDLREVVHPKVVEAHNYKHATPHHYDGYRLNELLSSDDNNGQVEDKLKTKKSKKKSKQVEKPTEEKKSEPKSGFTHAYIQEDLDQH